MAKKATLQTTAEYKKDTRNGKKHFNTTQGAPIAGALYFTEKQLKDMGATTDSTLRVTVAVADD